MTLRLNSWERDSDWSNQLRTKGQGHVIGTWMEYFSLMGVCVLVCVCMKALLRERRLLGVERFAQMVFIVMQDWKEECA